MVLFLGYTAANQHGQLSLFPDVNIKYSIDKVFELIPMSIDINDYLESVDKNMLEGFIINKRKNITQNLENDIIDHQIIEYEHNENRKSNHTENNYENEFCGYGYDDEHWEDDYDDELEEDNYNVELGVSFKVEDVIQNNEFLKIVDNSNLLEMIERLIHNIKAKVTDINNELDSDREIDENLSLFID